MKRGLLKIVPFALALALLGAGVAGPANQAGKTHNVAKALNASYNLIEARKYDAAKKLLDQVLAKDPGNPLALNNLAAVMVAEKSFDKAYALLNQALPKAKGYKVQDKALCVVGSVCMAFKPPAAGMNPDAKLTLMVKNSKVSKKTEVLNTVQDLEPLININREMVKDKLKASAKGKKS